MSEPQTKLIPLDRIDPNPDQPRKIFASRALQELADSIHKRGLLQAISVRPAGARYMIIGGERRWRAHKLLVDQGHLKADAKIKCSIENVDDREVELLAIVENLQRADLSPFEEAKAFKRMIDKGWETTELAQELGTSVFRIDEKLALLRVDSGVQKLVESGQISFTTATLMADIPAHRQTDLVRRISAGTLRAAPNDIRAAIEAVKMVEAQPDLMELPAAPSPAAREALTRLERKVEQVVNMVGAGFDEGDCVTAKRVNPGRLETLVSQLELCRRHMMTMERQLRDALAQAEILAAE